MSDHNQDDDKKLKDASQDVADSSVTSFDDLEDDYTTHGDQSVAQQGDELLSFAEEEAGHKLSSDDDFDLPDFDNSFAGQDDDQMANQGAEMAGDFAQDTAGESSSPVDDGFDELEDDFDLDFGSEDVAPATEQAEPKAVEVIVNPTFDPVKQQAKDPFPLPDDLAPAEEVYSEPVPSLEAVSDTAEGGLDLEMDLTEAEKADLVVETPDVSLEVAEEVVAAHEEDLLADEDEDNFGAPLTAPEMETLSEPEGGAASEVMAAQSAGFDGLDLDIADDDLDDMEMEELPDL